MQCICTFSYNYIIHKNKSRTVFCQCFALCRRPTVNIRRLVLKPQSVLVIAYSVLLAILFSNSSPPALRVHERFEKILKKPFSVTVTPWVRFHCPATTGIILWTTKTICHFLLHVSARWWLCAGLCGESKGGRNVYWCGSSFLGAMTTMLTKYDTVVQL